MRDSAWLFNSNIPEEALKIGENLGLGMSAFLIPHSATGSFAEAVVRINELKEGGPEAARLRQEIAEKEAALAKQNSELVKRSEALLKAQQEKSASDAEGLQLKSKIDSLTAEFKTQEREIASLLKQKDLRYLISRVVQRQRKNYFMIHASWNGLRRRKLAIRLFSLLISDVPPI